MKYEKLAADCDKDLIKLVRKASKIEERTVANFIRIACSERAKKILEEKQNV